MKKSFIILALFCLTACSQPQIPFSNPPVNQRAELDKINQAVEVQSAQKSLESFLNALAASQYGQAIAYYGGDYQELQQKNPEVSPEFKEKLWQDFCSKNKGICLNASVSKQEKTAEGDFKFTVQYFDKSGALYATPGCTCKGGGKTEFEFAVKKIADKYVVTSLPPIAIE